MNLLVKEVITNNSTFERSLASDSAMDLNQLVASNGTKNDGHPAECSQRLVIHPRHNVGAGPHNCPMCPANLCKVQDLHRHMNGVWARDCACHLRSKQVVAAYIPAGCLTWRFA